MRPAALEALADERHRWRQAIRRSAVVRPRLAFLARELARRRQTARYRLRGSGLAVHVRHDSGDAAGLDEIFLAANYDPPPRVAALLGRLARERPLRVVDLGANIGLFALTVFAAFDRVSVVCFEPDPDNARVLDLTRRASGRERDWQLVRACAGASSRRVAFQAGLYMESRVAEDGDPGATQVEMLDVFPHLAGADLLKVDIEGGEWEILSDARFAALEIPAIALEYHPDGCPAPDPRAEIIRLLEGAGYTIEPYAERAPGLGELWASRRP